MKAKRFVASSAVLLGVLSIMFVNQALAGCAQKENATCLVLTEGEELSQSCDLAICANVHQYSLHWDLADGRSVEVQGTTEQTEIRVNGKPGVGIPHQVLKEDLSCFGLADMSEVICAVDAPY